MIKFATGFASACILALTAITPANAVVFNITYTDSPELDMSGNVVGTGSLSYNGPAVAGSYALDTLTGLAFSATIGSISFTLADITTDLSAGGILVSDLGGGEFGFVFSGDGSTSSNGGSVDFAVGSDSLTHEPTTSIADATGCCGGDGVVNLYGSGSSFGAYAATTGSNETASAVPVPASLPLVLAGMGALGLVARRRKQA